MDYKISNSFFWESSLSDRLLWTINFSILVAKLKILLKIPFYDTQNGHNIPVMAQTRRYLHIHRLCITTRNLLYVKCDTGCQDTVIQTLYNRLRGYGNEYTVLQFVQDKKHHDFLGSNDAVYCTFFPFHFKLCHV